MRQEEKESWWESIKGVLLGSPVGGALSGVLAGLAIHYCGFLGEVPGSSLIPTCAFMGMFVHMLALVLLAIRGIPKKEGL
jgi:hypothetical protein